MKYITESSDFQKKLLAWYRIHGRTHLPWQNPRSFYNVYLSEIMLQQTQVTTVIPYFERFIQRFPDIKTLANAKQDEVLSLWTGLGYYARARNLHKAAKMIQNDFNGEEPKDFESILSLPGVGRSTACAILSQCYLQPYAILDGNVKRILARVFEVKREQSEVNYIQALWEKAQMLMPKTQGKHCCDYTQGIMDLGATICTRTRPKCDICPVKSLCASYQNKTLHLYPNPKATKIKPVKQTWFWILRYQNEILLHKRPEKGIWGGLWSFLESEPGKQLSLTPSPKGKKGVTMRHTFTHYHLDYTPVTVDINNQSTKSHLESLLSRHHVKWYKIDQTNNLGLPTPVVKLIQDLANQP